MYPDLKEKCDQHGVIYTDQEQIDLLGMLLWWEDKDVDSFFSNVERNTDITVLINSFKSSISGAGCLCQLPDDETSDDSDVKRCIQAAFPNWNYKQAANISKHLIVDSDKRFFSYVLARKNSSKYSETITDYKRSLNEKLASRNDLFLQKLLYDLNMSLLKLTSNLDSLQKIKVKLDRLINGLDSETKIIELIKAIEIIFEWNVDIIESEALDIILNSTELTVRKNIHNFVLTKFFSKTYEKSWDQLINELSSSNSEGDTKFVMSRSDLEEEYRKVMKAYNEKVSRTIGGSIKSWDKSLIVTWSSALWFGKMVKSVLEGNLTDTLLEPHLLMKLTEAFPSTSESYDSRKAQAFSDHVINIVTKEMKLAVIIQALEVTFGVKVREVQILSIILLLNSKMDKGRLAQISTGEGKTIIIAALAAYYALEGRKVDVVTSSELLVHPQLNKLKDFYASLLLSVSHNFECSSAYSCDVVYGTSSRFQGDILRDEFRKLGTRHGRRCDVVIVDEVDNMLIDGNDHMVYVSCTMPGMDHLQTLLAIISVQVKAAAAALRMIDGRLYFVQCENAIDENGEIIQEIVENCTPIDVPPQEFIKKATDSHLRKLIRDCDESALGESAPDYPEIKIPKHLRKLISEIQLETWIDKAILAKLRFTNKEDYIIDKDEVKIVDAKNTGVVEDNLQWSDGLHQFIQIKHGACLTPESFTTNFISNVSYFRRYGTDIYGLTGTLGCRGTREFLKNTYSVDDVIILPFKLKQHRELMAIVIENEEDWLREIVKNSLRKLMNGRAVMVIMKYIRQIEAIEKIFIDDFNYDKNLMKLYKTDGDSAVIEKSMKCGDVLITTNIAGRGADIKVHEDVDKNGGLHVCLTFLPKNSRVEEQNIGRTSRTGNRGTSQFILNKKMNIVQLRNQRDQKEATALAEAANEVRRVTMRDDVFHKFCKLTDIIKGRNEFVRELERKAVEERFAIWLKMNESKIANESRSEVFKLFEDFSAEILKDEKMGKLVKNPYMYVKIGNKYLEEKEYVKAIEEYTLAIELDPDFAEHAHFNRGYALIAQYGRDLVKNADEIKEAIRDFRRSRKLIEEKEHNLYLMQHASENQVYSKQISNKLNLYGILKGTIETAIGPDKKAIDRSVEDLKKRQSKSERDSDGWKKITEVIEDLEERRKNVGVIQKARNNEYELRIKIVDWKECLPIGDDSYDREIEEFKTNGAIGSFVISELPPINWPSVIALLLLGFGEMIVGAALVVFSLGAGANFGAALIAEGISDIITAVKDGIINRDFSWERWAIEKAISLTISVVCLGWAAMRDVAMTIRGGTRIAGGLGRVAVPQMVREGWKIAFRKVGTDLTKAAAKEFIAGLVNHGINETFVPWLRQSIFEIVEEPITEALRKNRNVTMMLELDKRENNSRYEDRIRKIGLELLTPGKSSKSTAKFAKFAEKMSNRIADHQLPQTTTYRKIHALKASATKDLLELPVVAYEFVKDLNEAIDKMAKEEKIEERYKDGQKTKIRGDVSIGAKASDKRVDSDVDVGRFEAEEEQVKPQHSGDGALRIAMNFSDSIAKTIVNVIQHDYAAPLVQMGTGYTVDGAMANRTETLNEYIETFKNRRRAHRMMD